MSDTHDTTRKTRNGLGDGGGASPPDPVPTNEETVAGLDYVACSGCGAILKLGPRWCACGAGNPLRKWWPS